MYLDNQYVKVNNETIYYHMLGEQGLSVHISENNEEILIGAPGLFSWKGSVIRYKSEIHNDIGGLSRREDTPHSIKKTATARITYSSDIPNKFGEDHQDGSYFGYAVTSGYFFGPNTNKILYVASAPQSNNQEGAVIYCLFYFY